jgi:putative ABC transport system ATP-binding protein
MTYIIAENLVKHYQNGFAPVRAISGINFEIHAGEFVAIMGESGAGKSTLLSIMGAMNAPTSGSLRVDDIDIYRLGPDQRADFRREFLGFVFQSFHLIPYLTVIENVMLPLTTARKSGREKQAMAEEALISVGLQDKGHRLPSQISGGEKESAAIARAIVNHPRVLLADEPTGNLDSKTTREIMKLLQRLNSEDMTIIMVTHSHECAGFTRRILQLYDGRLVASG